MEEFTRLQDDELSLGNITATFRDGYLFLEDEFGNEFTLNTEEQFQLLEALYERRFPLYRATHLMMGEKAPDWVESGKAGHVFIAVDGEREPLEVRVLRPERPSYRAKVEHVDEP